MEINYTVKNDKQTINQLLQSELKISSRLLFKLIKMHRILLNFNRYVEEIINILYNFQY